MRRKVFGIVSWVSLIMWVGAGVMWGSTLGWEMLVGHTSMTAAGAADWEWEHRAVWSVDAGLFFEVDRWVVGNPRFVDQTAEKPGKWNYEVGRRWARTCRRAGTRRTCGRSGSEARCIRPPGRGWVGHGI